MKAHVVSISKEAYQEVISGMPASARFTNVEEWGFNHVWLYTPDGNVVILTPEPIQKLSHFKLEGIGQ